MPCRSGDTPGFTEFRCTVTRPDPLAHASAPHASPLGEPDFWQQPWLHRALLGLFLLMLAVISFLALSPAPPKQATLGWDKLNHASAFAGLCTVGLLAWPRRRVALWIGLLAYGGAIEVLQSQVPGRSGEWADLLADSAGLALGLLLAWALQRAARVLWHPQRTPAAREMG